MIQQNFWTHPDPRVQTLELASWMKTLDRFSASEIDSAWNQYQRVGPRKRNGALEKPQAVQLARIIDDMHRLHRMQPLGITHEPPEPEPRPRASAAAANAIVAEHGYMAEHLARVKRFPRAASRDELAALDGAEQQREPHWSENATPAQMKHLEKVRKENPLIQEARGAAAAAARRKAAGDDAA